ncbi:hypothetical protein [Actinorugispora endophytica]|uniref:Uncharacterized protein n=1 Tax=Actinorugispora endophytica TaxID=1605990 RepID=A0A4R6V2C0_9ACTN|nr:hypothetical protein [Actinorugispora endophytica]TDQ54314.1 hypothetical protein EV190_102148 [Actinorugispora endophytica]
MVGDRKPPNEAMRRLNRLHLACSRKGLRLAASRDVLTVTRFGHAVTVRLAATSGDPHWVIEPPAGVDAPFSLVPVGSEPAAARRIAELLDASARAARTSLLPPRPRGARE